MPHSFFHLRGVLGDAELRSEQESAIDALLTGTYTDKNIEKLQGYDIFRLKLSRGSRLLFTTIKIDGHAYLLVLEHLPNHEYDKSKFLRSGALDKYLDKNAEAYARDALVFEEIKAADLDFNLSNNHIEVEGAELDYCQRQIIQLDTDQVSALSVVLPAVIKGPPGSGKSALAQIYISNYLLSLTSSAEAAETRVLYLTHSENLVDTIKTAWESTPECISAQDAGHEVNFYSYADLVSWDSGLSKENFKGKAAYLNWYKTYIKKEKDIRKNSPKNTSEASAEESFIPSPDKLYQEFRICSGYTAEAYHALSGIRQSLFVSQSQFVNQSHRAWVLEAFLSYQTTIGDNINPDFYVMKEENIFDLVIYDEAQDGSYNQLKAADQLAKASAVIFCLDSKQRIHDMRSSLDYIKSTFNIDASREIQLKLTHRCSLQVTSMANELSQFQGYLTGGVVEKGATSVINALGKNNALGGAYLLNPKVLDKDKDKDKDKYAWLNAEKSTEFAVVTSEEKLDEARNLFNTHLVYTPEQIKGLEFNEVVTYKLFEHPIFKQVKTRLSELGDKRVSPTNRPKAKDGMGHEEFVPYFNELYTAFTRPRQKLVICETRTHQNQALFDALSAHANEDEFVLAALSAEDNSPDNWLLRIKEMIKQKSSLAQSAYANKISDNPADFIAFEAEVLSKKNNISAVAAAEPAGSLEAHEASELDLSDVPEKTKKQKAKKTAAPINAEEA
ncbi:MAG: hypothetical protein QNK11_05175, partial [Legionella sp.]|nr:hypothetical protein [Legionella sp.]